MTDLEDFFEQPISTDEDVAQSQLDTAFKNVRLLLDHPEDITPKHRMPNLLIFFAEALKKKNFKLCENYMKSPELWFGLLRFRYLANILQRFIEYTQNTRDYLDIVIMRAHERGLIEELPDGPGSDFQMLSAALKYRVGKVTSYLNELAASSNEIDRNNAARLTALYSD